MNLLREELRAVVEVRTAVLRDRELEASDPAHRDALLIQTLKEVGQFTRAISVLERLERGDLIEVEIAPALPVLGQWSAPKKALRMADGETAGLL